jgi:hypothetical protein
MGKSTWCKDFTITPTKDETKTKLANELLLRLGSARRKVEEMEEKRRLKKSEEYSFDED